LADQKSALNQNFASKSKGGQTSTASSNLKPSDILRASQYHSSSNNSIGFLATAALNQAYQSN
jgi:hypothetical protein